MARSSWKLPFINTNLLSELTNMQRTMDIAHIADPSEFGDTNNNSLKSIPGKITVYSRASIVPSSMLGLSVQVYNGNKFLSFKVEQNHLGKKFGEFAQTRKILAHKEVKKKKLIKK